MSVKILYFGKLRELSGKTDTALTLSGPMTVEEILCQVFRDDNHLKTWRDKILYAVNQEQVKADFVVHDGDDVAFMPPMAGG